MAPHAKFIGLTRASSVAFTLDPDGDELSLLYSNLQVSWNNGSPDPKSMPAGSLTVVTTDEALGRELKIDLRGYATPGAGGTIHVRCGGKSHAVHPADDYQLTTFAALADEAHSTLIEFLLDLPKPTDGSAALLTLDSADIWIMPETAEQPEE